MPEFKVLSTINSPWMNMDQFLELQPQLTIGTMVEDKITAVSSVWTIS